MFTVRCAANVLSQVTIICLVNLSLRKVLFKFQQQQNSVLFFAVTGLEHCMTCDRCELKGHSCKK